MENSKIKVGDVILSVFRYSMTIPMFFKVIKRTAKTCTMVELNKKVVQNLDGYGQRTREIPSEEPDGREKTYKIFSGARGEYVKVDGKISYVWDGKPAYADYCD
jgi:hypothetical protein